MVIARIKGLKISLADERLNPTGEEMIPFLDGNKNGRIRMADFKGMALHVLNTKGTLTELDLTELQDAINAGKVIFIPNKDNTGLKVVTEVSTKDHVIHLESPDYELEANGDKISKVWFDTVDIDTSTKQVTRSTRETTALKTKGNKTDVLTANGSYTPINEIALVKVDFKTGEVTKSYDLTSTGITFRDDETPSVHWEVEKDGNALYMSLKIDKATQTLDGLMSKEDKFKLDVTIPGDIDALNKRCNRLRKSINQTKEALQLEVDTRTKEVARLDGKINDEAEHREHGDAELKALLNKETEARQLGDSTFQSRLDSVKTELDRKYESKTDDLETKLSKEITDRTEADSTAKKLFDEFKNQKGKNNGLAELGSDGKIPAALLPSYVDDVKEFVTKDGFPNTGETGIIYVDTTTNLTYRWSGTEYVEISLSLALGETASTAFPGNRGKALEDKLKNQPNTIVTALTDPTEDESLVKINYRLVTKNDSGYGLETELSVTIPAATSTHAGVMTADDKKKYDGLDSRITKEADRATEAEERLERLIETNDSKSNAADLALRQEIEKERTERLNAVDAEKNRATQKENELDSEIDAETSRAEKKESELEGKITLERNDRTTIDTLLQQKNIELDSKLDELTKKDLTHDSKLQLLETQLNSTTSNPITIDTTGSGNAITKATLSGKALTFSKETTFVDTTSALTITGVKTFTLSQLFQNSSININHPYTLDSTSTTARGLMFKTHDWGSNEAGIGTLDTITTNSTALKYIYLGWGTSPWESANCLAVADNKLTYKNYNIQHEGLDTYFRMYAGTPGNVGDSTSSGVDSTPISIVDWAKSIGTNKPGLYTTKGWGWNSTRRVTLSDNSTILSSEIYSCLDFRHANINNAWRQNAFLFLPAYGHHTGTTASSGSIYINTLWHTDAEANITGTTWRYAPFNEIESTFVKKTELTTTLNNYYTKTEADNKYVTLITSLTISGVKTFTQSLLFDASSIHIKNRASGSNATGIFWKANDWSDTKLSIGCYSDSNAGHYGYIGWGATPWDGANNLKVSDTKLTYKNYNIPYESDTKWSINVDKLDGKHNTDFFLSNRGAIDTNYVDLNTSSVGLAAFKPSLASGAYDILRDGYTNLLLHFLNGGSTSALEFSCSYNDDAPLYFRKTIDNNRVSGPWSEIITALHPQNITGAKTFTEQTVHQKGFVASAASRITSVSDITSLAQGDGALMVSGGVGIQKKLIVGSTSKFTGQATFSSRIIANNGIKATVGSASTATDWTNSGVFAGADTYPLVLYFANGTANKRILYFTISEKKDAFNICLANDTNHWVATGLSIFNNGDVQAYHNLSVDAKVGIGTPSPDAKLHVLGNAYISDALTVNNSVTATHFYKSSDIRLKTNVKQLGYTLEQICAIPTISFDLDSKHQIGTTAQGLEELGFNELVHEEDTRKSTLSNTEGFEPFEKNGEEYVKVKKVEYDTLSILALEGVKLLRDEVEKLKAEIETLKSKCYE